MTKNKPKIIAIVGPTSSGKSELAVDIALYIKKNSAKFGIDGAEIISADSRQVYKGMSLGSGKISKKEMRKVPHHLLDVVSPNTRFTAAHYQRLAKKAIDKIIAENKMPIICGGTGFYIKTVLENLELPGVKPDLRLRKKLEDKSPSQLYKMLLKLDPRRAKDIDFHNPVRLIRAIEISQKLGNVPGLKESEISYNPLYIGISPNPRILKERIRSRILKRLGKGMIGEVKKLHSSGVSWKRLEGFGLEYRFIGRFLTGKISKKTMIDNLEKETNRYAKRQMTWFKKNKEIAWINNTKKALPLVKSFILS